MILELKVTLRDVGVPVWRKLQVDSRITFQELHEVLQLAFDWTNSHLHSFFVKKTDGVHRDQLEIKPDDDIDTDMPGMFDTYNENQEVLSNWFRKINDKVLYIYDFGDDWQHEITLVKKISAEKGTAYPRCIGARNIAPDEDSRLEVIMEEAELKYADSKQLVVEINEMLLNTIVEKHTDILANNRDPEFDNMEDVLLLSKKFHKLKPWNYMGDQQIFAIKDPATEELLFCSVLGKTGKIYGLAVYIGKEGYASLLRILNGSDPNFDFILKQRGLLISFQDREDLEKRDYELIKTYNVPFRGRKTWPEFRSFRPGYVPWSVDAEDVRILKVVLEQAIDVCGEIANGLQIPNMYKEEEIFVKVPEKSDDEIVFENQLVSLENYRADESTNEIPLLISEFDLKRITRLRKVLPVTVEFSFQHLNIPVQENDYAERPVFPIFVVAADHEQGFVFYKNLVTSDSLYVGTLQRELVNMLSVIEEIPEIILMDRETATFMKPLIDKLQLYVEVEDRLMVVEEVMSGLKEQMKF